MQGAACPPAVLYCSPASGLPPAGPPPAVNRQRSDFRIQCTRCVGTLGATQGRGCARRRCSRPAARSAHTPPSTPLAPALQGRQDGGSCSDALRSIRSMQHQAGHGLLCSGPPRAACDAGDAAATAKGCNGRTAALSRAPSPALSSHLDRLGHALPVAKGAGRLARKQSYQARCGAV